MVLDSKYQPTPKERYPRYALTRLGELTDWIALLYILLNLAMLVALRKGLCEATFHSALIFEIILLPMNSTSILPFVNCTPEPERQTIDPTWDFFVDLYEGMDRNLRPMSERLLLSRWVVLMACALTVFSAPKAVLKMRRKREYADLKRRLYPEKPEDATETGSELCHRVVDNLQVQRRRIERRYDSERGSDSDYEWIKETQKWDPRAVETEESTFDPAKPEKEQPRKRKQKMAREEKWHYYSDDLESFQLHYAEGEPITHPQRIRDDESQDTGVPAPTVGATKVRYEKIKVLYAYVLLICWIGRCFCVVASVVEMVFAFMLYFYYFKWLSIRAVEELPSRCFLDMYLYSTVVATFLISASSAQHLLTFIYLDIPVRFWFHREFPCGCLWYNVEKDELHVRLLYQVRALHENDFVARDIVDRVAEFECSDPDDTLITTQRSDTGSMEEERWADSVSSQCEELQRDVLGEAAAGGDQRGRSEQEDDFLCTDLVDKLVSNRQQQHRGHPAKPPTTNK